MNQGNGSAAESGSASSSSNPRTSNSRGGRPRNRPTASGGSSSSGSGGSGLGRPGSGAQSQGGRPHRGRISNRVRIILLLILVGLLVLILSLRGIASFYTDYLWFDSIDQTQVWSYVLIAKIVIAAIAVALFFVLLWISLLIADRLAPKTRPQGPEEDALARWHALVGKRKLLLRSLVALVFALIVGVGASSRWQEWLLFINRKDFGVKDPQFNLDVGFYVFQLPFWTFVVEWLFTAFLVVFFVTAVFHYLNGGIRLQPVSGPRVLPAVKAHLSVLLGILALVRAGDYWLDRYLLTTSTQGAVDGVGYTDANARLPVLYLLVVIALLAFVLFIYNIWRKGWALPVIAVGLWAFASLIMGNIYPFIVQRFQVEPAESTRERELIENNIASTRQAIGLDNVETRLFETGEQLSYDDIQASDDNIASVPLLDPEVLPQTFENLEGERGFYRFPPDLDVDRYEVDGEVVPVVLGARQLNPDRLPTNSWEASRLTYTHGYGLALAPANMADAGLPNFVVGGLSLERNELGLSLDEPRVYFAEDLAGYAIVNTDRQEVDEAQAESSSDEAALESYSYEGDGGVEIGGWLRKAAFALRFGDIDPLISNFVRNDSRVLYVRDVRERVEKLAPFLHFDSDPYAVISEGRIKYVMDAYTTTSEYPFSQRADTEQLPGGSGLRHEFNYVRNSVKAVVDSFDGSVTLYQVDPDDPIINAYGSAFPNLLTSKSEMPADLLAHVRYPSDLFRVQTNVWSRYQLGDPQKFYEQAEGWAVAQDPGGVTGAAVTAVVNEEGQLLTSRERRFDPYYTLLRLPGEDKQQFVILRPYVPISAEDTRKELAAFMVAVSDDEDYGKLVVYRTPGGDIDGPALVNSKIQSDPNISRVLTLLDQRGSQVVFGDLLLVPVNQSILYVRPLYVVAESTQVPELQQVIAVLDESVVMCPQLDEALEALFGLRPLAAQSDSAVTSGCSGTVEGVLLEGGTPTEPTEPAEPTTPTTPTTSTTRPPSTTSTTLPDGTDQTTEQMLAQLLAQASEAFEAAEAALQQGNLGEYQAQVERAQQLIGQASNLLG